MAAVDLGSNSFHMLLARMVHGQLQPVDKIREQVQLASGLHKGQLDPEAQDRALACLERFGQRLRDLPGAHVRAVGTNTLRQTRDPEDFLERAERALGHSIEILPGREEARLVYLGAAHDLANDGARRLVVDIGGGSTECIIGERVEPIEADSLYMGCVSFSQQYFGDGVITRDRMKKAIIAAQLELQSIERRYRDLGWKEAVGTSGTINAIEAVVVANGWSQDGITPKGLKKLRKALVSAGSVQKLSSFSSLAADRAPVFPGGVAILCAVFESLDVQHMIPSAGALREGLAYDLVGRMHDEDIRDRTVDSFTRRYHVDREQAARVEQTALALFQQIDPSWSTGTDDARRYLCWAARLHEIGAAVAYSGYHKHGAYLVAHGDMPGFSRQDRQALAALIQGHRRKLRRSNFTQLPSDVAASVEGLCIVLRLAVLLNRGRSTRPMPEIHLDWNQSVLSLRFPEGWLEEHPLTRADLENEAGYLRKGAGVTLRFA